MNRLIESDGVIAHWRILRRRWKRVLILSPLLGLMAGVLATLLQTPQYEARALLEIQDLNDNFMNMKQVSPITDSGVAGAPSDVQTQIKLLQTDPLLERVVAKMKSRGVGPRNDERAIVSFEGSVARGLFPSSSSPEAEISRLKTSLRVRAIGQTRIVELTADSSNPRLAADFINQLCTDFIDQNMEARLRISQSTGEWLSQLLDELRVKLRRSEAALQDYARASGLMFTSEKKGVVAEDKLHQLQDELVHAQADRIAKQARYEMAKRSPAPGLPDVLSESSIRDYRSRLTDLRRQRAELAATYTDGHAKIKRLDAQIASLNSAIEAEQKDIVRRIQNEYEASVRRETLVSSDYAAQSRLVAELGERGIQYGILQREVDSTRQLYDSMLQRVKEATVASAMRATNISVVNPAQPPANPYEPKPIVNCALGVLLFSFLGIGFAVMREHADSSLREPGEASSHLGIAELGVVLHDRSSNALLHSGTRRVNSHSSGPLGITGPGVPDVSLPSVARDGSFVLESLRAVLTSLLLPGPDASAPGVLVVTSASPVEGKTTVVANLGLLLAQMGRRVLLVDGDLRQRGLCRLFNVANDGGFTTLLGNKDIGRADPEALVRPTSVPGLCILPGGPSSPGEASVLHSPGLPELLQRLRRAHDVVLIDTPPVLPIPDARILGWFADGVILVARSGRTTREAAAAAAQRLAADGTRVVGLVLNDWKPESSPSAVKYYGHDDRDYTNAVGA